MMTFVCTPNDCSPLRQGIRQKLFAVVVDSANCWRWRRVCPLSAAMAARWFRSVGWSKVEQVVLRNCHGGPTPTPSFVSQPLEHFASTWCNQQEVLGEGEDERGRGGGIEFCVRRKVRGVRGIPLWMCSTPPVGACPVWALPQVKKWTWGEGGEGVVGRSEKGKNWKLDLADFLVYNVNCTFLTRPPRSHFQNYNFWIAQEHPNHHWH